MHIPNKYLRKLCLLFILSTFCFFSFQCAGVKKDISDIPLEILLNDGMTYFYLGEYEAALQTWKLCLERKPEDAELLNFVGIAIFKKEEYENAIEYFKKAIALKKEGFPDPYNNLGYTLFLTGKYKEAEKYFQLALSIDPYFTQASSNLKTVQRIISGSLDIRAYKLFQKSASTENLTQNIKYYEEAIEIDPNYAEAHNNLGVVRYYNGEFEGAIEEFKKAIELNPNYPEAHNNIGYLYDDMGKYDEAISEYLKAIESRNDYLDAYNNLGSTYFNLGQYDDAVQVWKKILELFPYNDEAQFNLNRLAELREVEDIDEDFEE